ncbi:hypothetical protein FACS189446_7870 [Bacteroidia bacterium]|nr:hypothetical protein FACS189446_7870 [Bacteroidia bacterium]
MDMKRVILFFLVASSFFPGLFSQTLKGKVVDVSGKPVPSVSVYIKELKQGLICDVTGEFQIKLKAGTYHLECRCIGYDTENKTVSIEEKDVEIQITLTEKNYQLPTVEIRTGEDPAYAIMRKAIAKAPYYQSVVKKSTYQIYSKVSGKMTKTSKLFEILGGKELDIYKNKLFLQEAATEIKFEEPNRYEKNVIAYSSSFPNGNDPQEAISAGMISLYHPKIGSVVSPLHPQAFDYYRFQYEGYEEDNGQIINKIKILPKLNDPKLLRGTIYIADDEWNIRHAELYFSGMGMKQHIVFNYHPVMDGIYLVTNAENHADVNMFGINLFIDFLHAFQYTDIQLNDSLIALAKSAGKIKPEKKKKSLEIKRNIDTTTDSLATRRDSTYWVETRTVTLNEEELQSYARRDTLQAKADSIDNARRNPKFEFSDLITGGVVGKDSAFVQFRYSGLKSLLTEYNFVDGVWLGQSFELNFKRKKNTGFIFKPSVYWASARKTLIYKGDITFDYAPLRLGQMSLSAGNTSTDYSAAAGPERIVNALFSLYGGRNLTKRYNNKYVEIYNSMDIDNGLNLGIGLTAAKRTSLENHTTWNIFGVKNQWTPNRPEYAQDLNSSCSGLAAYTLNLQYTPQYYYEIREGKKRYRHSDYPTFEASYQQGFSAGNLIGDYSTFSKAQMLVRQTVSLGIFSQLNYTLIAGKFFNKNSFNYIDYKHFSTAGDTWFSSKFSFDAYNLLPFYQYSTNKEWVQAFVDYRTDYLLLKRLPFLQGKMFSENLHFKFLHTPEKPYYSEWGYSVDLPGGIAGIGIYAAFDKTTYKGVGLQISLPLMQMIKRR